MTWSDWVSGYNWDGEKQGDFAPYSETVIDFGTFMATNFPYGLMQVGTAQDEINFNIGVATSKVLRLAYNDTNLATAKASGRQYEYDENYIYLERETPVTYSIDVDGDYDAFDHGMEFFTGTVQAVYAQTLYGQNLKNKLERDVLTISQQTLTAAQRSQVRANIGLGGAATQGVANNLTTTSAGYVLDARQGNVLNSNLKTISTYETLGSFGTQSELDTLLTSVSDGMTANTTRVGRISSTATFGFFESGSSYFLSLSKGGSDAYASGYLRPIGTTRIISISKAASVWTYFVLPDKRGGLWDYGTKTVSDFQTALDNDSSLYLNGQSWSFKVATSDANNGIVTTGAHTGVATRSANERTNVLLWFSGSADTVAYMGCRTANGWVWNRITQEKENLARAYELRLTSANNTWAKIWPVLSAMPMTHPFTIYVGQDAISAFTNGKITTGYYHGVGLRLSATNSSFVLYNTSSLSRPTLIDFTNNTASSQGTVNVSKVQSDKSIQTGTVAGTTQVAVGTYGDYTVTFPRTMVATPRVIVSPTGSSGTQDMNNGKLSYFVIDSSTTGFTVRMFNNSSIQRPHSFNWIAVVD
jgi:hypothetical protein